MLARTLFGGIALVVAAVIVQSLPDIRRYLEIREM